MWEHFHDLSLSLYAVFFILLPWRRPKHWACVRFWRSFSSVYSPLENRISSRHPVSCFSRNFWRVRKISPSTALEIKSIAVVISDGTHIRYYKLIFLSQLFLSVGGQREGDEGAGQTLVSSVSAHASRGGEGLQCVEWEVRFPSTSL